MSDRRWVPAFVLLLVSLPLRLSAQPPTVQFVTVDLNVKLEVLDWGGSGRPVVLLAGLGNTADVFDEFAPKLTGEYHVYGITRRGFGASSAPASGYSADRLGDDVLAVLNALKLERPVLVGHSIAGEELSSVGSRYPERIAGLVYLDAGYGYAYYDRSRGSPLPLIGPVPARAAATYLSIDLAELQKKLEQLEAGNGLADPNALIQGLLDTSLPGFETELQEMQKDVQATPTVLLDAQAQVPATAQAIIAGMQKYTTIPVPILAIYADPHNWSTAFAPFAGQITPAVLAAYEAREDADVEAQVKAFESGVPSARVVRLPHADHYVFRSNQADVLREMRAFLTSLK